MNNANHHLPQGGFHSFFNTQGYSFVSDTAISKMKLFKSAFSQVLISSFLMTESIAVGSARSDTQDCGQH